MIHQSDLFLALFILLMSFGKWWGAGFAFLFFLFTFSPK
jgi:hypothetical protein